MIETDAKPTDAGWGHVLEGNDNVSFSLEV